MDDITYWFADEELHAVTEDDIRAYREEVETYDD